MRKCASAVPVQIIVVASVVLTICMGLRNSFGLFLAPMAADAGVTASTFGLSLAIQNLVWGLSQPVLGALADKMGTRPVLIGSAVIYFAGLLVMGTADRPVMGLGVGAGFLVGIGIAGTGFGTLMGAISRAVPSESRSWAIGVVAASGSLGTIAIAPLGQYLIDEFNWRTALQGFAALAFVMILLAFKIGPSGRTAETTDQGLSLSETLTEVKHRGFILMTAAFFACGFQLTFIATHLPGYLALCGLPPSVGASALALIGLFNAAGSYFAGWLGGRYNKSYLLAGLYMLRTIGVAAFLAFPISPMSTLLFAACMGLLWLSVAPLVSGLIAQLFGLRHFNTLFGIIFLSHQLGSFAGAWVGGAAKDATGSYFVGWMLMLLIGLFASLLQFLMDQRPAEPRLMLQRTL